MKTMETEYKSGYFTCPGRPMACVVLECSKNLAYASSFILISKRKSISLVSIDLFRTEMYFTKFYPPRLCKLVIVTPGLTELQRTFFAANSSATQRVN